MVLGIMTAIAACPAIIGTTEAIRHGQRENNREEHRGRKHNLVVTLLRRSEYSQRFDGAYIFLKDNKVWIDISGVSRREGLHPVTSYFLPYPNMEAVWQAQGFRRGEGMVTTISVDPPFLNWVYVDKETHEVKYGVRTDTVGQFVGPWDVTKTDRRLSFQGWEGFVAVEENEGDLMWALYFDVEDDGLRDKGRVGDQGKRMLALEIWRREPRVGYDAAMEEREDRIKARGELDNGSSASTTVS